MKRVEFVVLTSNDMKTWSGASNAVPAGGLDRSTYLKKRVMIPVPAPNDRLFIRLLVRPKS